MDRVKRGSEKTIESVANTVELWDMVLKLDELVQWINEYEKGESDG